MSEYNVKPKKVIDDFDVLMQQKSFYIIADFSRS